MQVRVKWVDGMAFVGETGTGHALVMDGAPEFGGRNLGARPMEMLLLGLGGCTAFDVVAILKKARQPVLDCEVTVDAVRSDKVPKVFTEIRVHYRVYGNGLAEKQVARAVELSSTRYCSASVMLGASAKIEHDFEVIEGPAARDRSARDAGE
ncbi:OsmC family protein [Thioalkalivibrio paradoxus]|uniref:Peroxiredoxin n=1 Tax=Thioalkalivibrio paradoxus ARh 1 TaxID=713585 RepID=W0DRM3_9GAMM|nr:OsmC family protein [Thioalkalivibrio paradoxus]AHE99510.1 peroxiredoxin [Thioalkalivibrio paradoxus ARh 1]